MPFAKIPKGYSTWQSMKQRCLNPKAKSWPDYGGRGITICREWKESFKQFISDMGEPPKGTSIERLNNNEGYWPNNCVWATRREQQINRRNTIRLLIGGESYLLRDLVERTGMNPATIRRRVKSGMTFEEVTNPTKRTYEEWSRIGRKKWSEAAKNKTHCIKGHELTHENTYLTKEGWKRCRQCHNAKMRRLLALKRAAASGHL